MTQTRAKIVFISALLLAGAAGCRTASDPDPLPAASLTAAPAPSPTARPRPGPSPEAPGPAAGALPAEAKGDDLYRLGAGDILKIAVYGEADLSGTFRIARNGTIAWSWVGEVEVQGLTVEEIAERLRSLLARQYIRQPRVETSVEKYGSRAVYFLGNISLPGSSRLGENRTLLQNLLQAGGPKIWGESTITILRASPDGKQERITASLQGLLDGAADENILLEDGDIVTVSSPDSQGTLLGQDRIYVVGAVNGPGTFPWRENLTALDALMAAGGLNQYAAGNRARLVRGTGEQKQEIPLSLEDILEGQKDKNLILSPGDLIIVPESLFF